MGSYLTAEPGELVLKHRLGSSIKLQTLPYGQRLQVGDVSLSLHPAGHILGSAQVRLEHRGEVAVISGDYKVARDSTCACFEPVKCHTFVSESTFGLPIYRWKPDTDVFTEINNWWADNQRNQRTSVLTGYALGKAQRALSGLDTELGPIIVHGSVKAMNQAYVDSGVSLPKTHSISEVSDSDVQRAIVIAPPSAIGSPWIRRFRNPSLSFMSGWMSIRGTRRRRGVERGFVLSDHADWPDLLNAIHASEADRVWLTHGYSDSLARFLRESGKWAQVLSTEWAGEEETAIEVDESS
jgi:putative mRNA 3-end processing factor